MSNQNKIKQLSAFRQTDINRMTELKTIAESALLDKEVHLQFKARFKHIEHIFDDFHKQHTSLIGIVSTIETENSEAYEAERTSFDNDYYRIQTIYEQIFEIDSQNVSQVGLNVSVASRNNVRLPKLEVPTFSGDVTTFRSFIDLYDTMIHDNDSLSNIEKFSYLISVVKGPALALIRTIPLCSENYVIAYNALIKRYDNKRFTAFAHFREIDETQKIPENQVNSKNLRKLLDVFTENLAALKTLKLPVEQWDFILCFMMLKRLDTTTVTRFELEEGKNDELPSFTSLQDFIMKQCAAYDAADFTFQKKPPLIEPQRNKVKLNPSSHTLKQSSSFFGNSTKLSCSYCNKVEHQIYTCPQFLSLSPKKRFEVCKQKTWCTNCLGSRHSNKQCSSSSACRECAKKHHTLLHFQDVTNVTPSPENVSQDATSSPSHPNSTSLNSVVDVLTSSSENGLFNSIVLLATARAKIQDIHGIFHEVRILLDCGSQSTFISRKCAKRLSLRTFKISVTIRGLGGAETAKATEGLTCTLYSTYDNTCSLEIDALILDRICNPLPDVSVESNSISVNESLKLADPNFGSPGTIDLLIGADLFPSILAAGRIVGKGKEPAAIETIFGWVLMGRLSCLPPSQINTNTFFSSTTSSHCLDETLRKFWELEEIPRTKLWSSDELLCEKIFCETVQRVDNGRYMVSLPFRDSDPTFGDSKSLALRRFLSLERRLVQNPLIYKDYCAFMDEYWKSGHMDLISDTSSSNHSYYIPHHCVLKPESSTTKLRVVFDASAHSSNERSLNDTLLVGPKLQRDIIFILLNFRLFSHVFTADIKQMYRQILVTPHHRSYQRILWRFSTSDPISEFQLNTVTYGTSCAPYLALRTIQQLAEDERLNFPLASQALLKSTYVDDLVIGTHSLESALHLQRECINLLKKGAFELRKWSSNHPIILSQIPPEHLHHQHLSFEPDDNIVKILGLQWHPSADCFSYSVQARDRSLTKRSLLSECARMFDPLGFLSPITFFAKLLIQHLWSLGLGWDDIPPQDVLDRWSLFQSQLCHLSDLKIQRQLFIENATCVDLHGFCDASEKGYAAVVYLRVTSNTHISASIVAARSKVAPLKRISLPRLELCGAVILAELIALVTSTFADNLAFDRIYAWSDSMVVLKWIRSSPHKLHTFVSNRVSQIQDKVAPACWNHVPSAENPADCASRGLFPDEIINHALWWAGPPWLSSMDSSFPLTPDLSQFTSPEVQSEERIFNFSALVEHDSIVLLLNKFSSLEKIKRIVAYMFRFIHNSRHPTQHHIGPFTIDDLQRALLILVAVVQKQVFSEDISRLKKGCLASKPLRLLNPFLDDKSLLRVGGRLKYASLSDSVKHPILLPRDHRLTYLIIENIHKQYLHPGVQAVQHLLLQQFWVLSAKRAIRTTLSKCLTCWRLNPTSVQPPMADLPQNRISTLKPFSCIGIDYGGPFLIKHSNVRGAKVLKAYLCIFVCFSTKAIHVELASDLSTEAFLACLRRFMARRGRCSEIHSDNGTNFTSAQKYISQLMKSSAEVEGIRWVFNPPSGPHFGGLHEAGIKSVKRHLSRVIGEQLLTYEELNTVLIQIEAILNSRPLCPLSADPNDLNVLTPGHFLTLEPLNTIPDENVTHIKLNRLNRWQLLLQLHQSFWKRWQAEYLHTLQQRGKWHLPITNISPGTLVLIKNDQLPPLKWQLGRVMETHPGRDGITRVVTLKTTQGVLKRPVIKVCPLPIPCSN